MTSGGCEVDIGGEGSTLKYMNNVLLHHRVLYCQAKPQTFTRSRVLHLTGKKLAFRFIASVLLIGHRPPYIHLASTWRRSRDRCSQAFPVFRTLPLLCIILNANRRTKTGEAWERGYQNITRHTIEGHPFVSFPIAGVECLHSPAVPLLYLLAPLPFQP